MLGFHITRKKQMKGSKGPCKFTFGTYLKYNKGLIL